ncbi:MAG: hypothetical protein WDO73_08745 [Ignavibacteriota bacterium]
MSRIAPQWVGLGVGVALLAILAGVVIRLRSEPKIVIGKNDEIYYYRRATQEDAQALGDALRKIGFFNDRGTSVLLWMGGGPTVVSFVLNNGALEHRHVLSNFTEIGRRIATSVGGFPIQIHLIDAERNVRRKATVGKTIVGSKDIVYYFGDATLADAKALAEALRSSGYFADRGATVALLKGEGTVVSFVVQDGLWDQPAVLATLDKLVRRIAPSVGGLPIELRMLDRNMDIKQTLTVQ